MKRLIILIILLSTFQYSCVSSFPFKPKKGSSNKPKEKILAYVINPELEHELKILHYSKLYYFTQDSSVDRKIRLYEIEYPVSCATHLILSFITLGLIPGILYVDYVYEYDEIFPDTTHHIKIDITLKQRFSIIEPLLFHQNTKRALGKAVARSRLNVSEESKGE